MNSALMSLFTSLVFRNPIVALAAGFMLGLQWEASHPGSATTILAGASQWLGATDLTSLGGLLSVFGFR